MTCATACAEGCVVVTRGLALTAAALCGRGHVAQLDGALRRDDAALAQKLGHPAGRDRLAEVEALGVAATGRDEEARLRRRLDAFGDEFDTELVGEPDRGAHDGGAAQV